LTTFLSFRVNFMSGDLNFFIDQLKRSFKLIYLKSHIYLAYLSSSQAINRQKKTQNQPDDESTGEAD